MPEGEHTEFSTPIPLRDNEFPNPYSRLESCEVIRQRLRVLTELLETHGAPDPVGLTAVLEGLSSDLRGAVWGDLAGVGAALQEGREHQWRASAHRFLYPTAGRPS